MKATKKPGSPSQRSGTNSPLQRDRNAYQTGDEEYQHGGSFNQGEPAAPAPPPPILCTLRVATYNCRVDHHEDINTVHEWPARRALVASTIASLGADIIALQEPSQHQAQDLEMELGAEWGVAVASCDPDAWAANPDSGPSDGQARDGNGVAWRLDRLTLLSTSQFWLGPAPDRPPREAAWGGSPYQRTCHVSHLRDKKSGLIVAVFSAHFDHQGDDTLDSGGSEARRQSAALLMRRARDALDKKTCDMIMVAGDFNTFEDRQGACYADLVSCASGVLTDVRDFPNVRELDCGRSHASWEGWESNPYCRAVAGLQRYDQIFVGSASGLAPVSALRTWVAEERYFVKWGAQDCWVYASDHAPVVAELAIPRHGMTKKAKSIAKLDKAAGKTYAAGGGPPVSALSGRTYICLGLLGASLLGLIFVFLLLVWEMAGGRNLECRLQCRVEGLHPPFDEPMSGCGDFDPTATE